MSSTILLPTKAPFHLTGGIHPPENKSHSAETALKKCPLPQQLMVPLNMHAGTDAESIVAVGDKVSKGQCIAKAGSTISAFIHSPVDGQIADIKAMPVANLSGLDETVVIIDCEQRLPTRDENYLNWSEQDPPQLLETIRLAGIVGLGGAGFPSDQKISCSQNESPILLLNGVECEPYISCDDRTMRDFSSEIIEGALILSRIQGCKKIQIAIEDNKPIAIAAMLLAVEKCRHSSIVIEVFQLPTIYPSGGERQLIEIMTGKQVPSGRFPAELGYTVQNVGTAFAVYEAVVKNKPLIDRIVTVTGAAVSLPGNYRVAIGTPIRHLLEFAGWDEKKMHRLIHGGPMMGFPLTSADRPISKTSNCIIAATKGEFPDPLPERPCIRCGQCADVCPASLLPQQLFWFSQSGEINKAKQHRLMDCIECGACAYVCPSQIPLVDYYRFTKGELRNREVINTKADQSKQRFDFRNQRLENNKLEKQLIRKEKARLREQNSQRNGTNDPNQQAVADALARVQAKKKAKAMTSKPEQADKDNTDVQ